MPQTDTAHLVEAFGLVVKTDFALPGSVPVGAGVADLQIAAGPAQIPPGAEVLLPYRRAGALLELEIPAIGRFVLRGPGQLEVSRDPQADDVRLGAFLVASGLPMLLWQRRGVLLHAAGVEVDGRLIAITGPSRSGKSTLARGLIEAGGKLVGDDSLWLPGASRPAFACGLNGGQFLRSEAGEAGEFRALEPSQRAAGQDIAAIVVLDHGAADMDTLAPVAAVTAILQARHRPRVADLLGRTQGVLRHCTALAATVPVVRLGLLRGDPGSAIAAIARFAGQLGR